MPGDRLHPLSRPIPIALPAGALASFGRADAIFAATLILVCTLTAFVGLASPIGSFAHDTFFFIDNAYRVAQGQIPHRDFSSAWGPLMFLIDAGGLLLSQMQPAGLGEAHAITGLVLALWAFLITRSRSHPIAACLVGIYTALLVTAPFALGSHPRDFSIAMTYNRYGYAIFGIMLVECVTVTAALRSRSAASASGALSTGAALSLLLFLKISYAFIAGPFVVACLLLTPHHRVRRAGYLGAGFLAITVVILAYLRFDVADMLHDLQMAAHARRASLNPANLLSLNALVENLPLAIAAAAVFQPSRGSVLERFAAPAVTLLTIGAGCLLLFSNQQTGAFPLDCYAAIILLADAAAGPISRPRRLVAIAMTILCGLPLAALDAGSLAAAAFQRQWPDRPTVPALDHPANGATLAFAPITGAWHTATGGAEYVAALNDGLDLLRRRTGPDDGVLTIDMFNPFNYLLNRPSPTGGFAAAAYHYVFDSTMHPTADRFFGNTRFVLVRKYPTAASDRGEEGGDVAGMLDLYGPQLAARFTQVEATDHWVLYQRRR